MLKLTTMSLIMVALRREVALLALDAAVGFELADISPEIVDLLRVLDAGKDHFGAGHHAARILDVFLELRLVPDDAGVLVGVGIIEAVDAAGMAAVKAVQLGADLVLGAIADGVAGQALVERNFALGDVLRRGRCYGLCGGACRYDDQACGNKQ